MKKVVSLIAFAFVVSALSCQHPAPPPITVLIVRHAEKASNEDDAPLSAAGVERAQALLRVAEDAGVGAIYSSQFRRNRDTVQPLAARLGLPITEMQVSLNEPGDYSKRLAQDILNKHRGRTVLVVGHRNTVPSLVEALSGKPAPALNDSDYDQLYIVTVPASEPAKVIKANFGRASQSQPSPS